MSGDTRAMVEQLGDGKSVAVLFVSDGDDPAGELEDWALESQRDPRDYQLVDITAALREHALRHNRELSARRRAFIVQPKERHG